VRIDKVKALHILNEEAASTAPAPKTWITRVQGLSAVCGGNKTFIAVLGTALLARAVEPTVDPFSLKDSTGPRGYSARSLCKDVLAANAPRLGIDLGVRGREPLNNQPFFAEDRISKDLPVRDSGREPLRLLLEALGALASIEDSKQARAALRAFLVARRVAEEAHEIGEDAGERLTEATLLRAIELFVSENSESGKRAQAVAAGLLDIEFGPERVEVGKVFDPSRHFPGDVVVRNEPAPMAANLLLELEDATTENYGASSLAIAYEVRDKPVTASDLYHFVQRALDHGGRRAVMLAVAPQPSLGADLDAALEWGAKRGVRLHLFLGWRDFLRSSMFRAQEGMTAGAAYRSIFKRLAQLEVSPEGVALWTRLGS
jgi:hypothetical protein